MEIEHHDEREFVKWFRRLGPFEREKAQLVMHALRVDGTRLGMPLARDLGDGLYELRIRYGQQPRLYFEFRSNELALMLTYGRKDTQDRDIRRARRRQR